LKLHILTAVTRPENLPRLAESIAAASFTPEWEIVWHLRFDPLKQNVGGHAIKNRMLDGIEDGWCWILDDDTVMHPELLGRLDRVLTEQPGTWALVVSQTRRDGRYLEAAEGMVKVGYIDAGQVIMRRDFIGDHRIPTTYEGDGRWLSDLLPGQDGVFYLDEALSLHNALCG
jgi:hypothetical protein